jgi:ferredoxin-NADP reductase
LQLGQLHEGPLHYDGTWQTRPLLLLAAGTGLAPLLSVLFMDEERASRRVHTLYGRIVEQAPASAAARARLLGEASAERALTGAFRRHRLVDVTHDVRRASGGDERAGTKRKAPEGGQKSIAAFFKRS